jgi:hypothetical protein
MKNIVRCEQKNITETKYTSWGGNTRIKKKVWRVWIDDDDLTSDMRMGGIRPHIRSDAWGEGKTEREARSEAAGYLIESRDDILLALEAVNVAIRAFDSGKYRIAEVR